MPDRPTHLDEHGDARMVDVGGKPVTARRAVAQAVVRMTPETAQIVAAEMRRRVMCWGLRGWPGSWRPRRPES